MLRQINGVATIKKAPVETGLYILGGQKITSSLELLF
jgi:hypothetical protein